MFAKSWAWCAVLCVSAWPLTVAAQDTKLDPDAPYTATRGNPVTYDVDFSAVVTPPYHAKVLKIWLPLPQTDAAQEVTEGALTSFPIEVAPRIGKEEKFGNKFAYFEFNKPEGAQIIRHKFKIKVYELHWNIDGAKVHLVKNWPADFDKYRKSETQAVVIDDQIQQLVNKLVGKPSNPLKDMTTVWTWAQTNLKYDHDHASLQASSLHAIEEMEGHCSDYHGLCSAMGRALGYPTRVTYGINPMPKNSPSHCKMEAFLPPYGWVSFDVSETQNLFNVIRKDENLSQGEKDKLLAAAEKRFLSGFRDNTWFKQTAGTDYDLAPPAAKKAAVVRTIYAEADGEALPEPDPANKTLRAFSWMTVHKFTPDRKVPYPFKDLSTLQPAQ
ncbi:MAG TPA: transglutaminase-like domain-containing protein [Pirellulales bacterium]|nr:transglutaminase-like domain-containing protein [Pirellulales bacterium]